MVIFSSESCAFKRQNAKLVFVVSNGHLSFQGHKIEGFRWRKPKKRRRDERSQSFCPGEERRWNGS